MSNNMRIPKKLYSNFQNQADGRQWRWLVTLLLCLLATGTGFVRAQEFPQPPPQDAPLPNEDRMIVRRGIRVDLQADLTPTRHPVIQVELYSERLFDGHNQIYSLRIGSHEFTNFNGNFVVHQVIFELTPQEFAKTRTGDSVIVKYGPTIPIKDKSLLRSWLFGRLDKDQVNRNPVRTFKGTSIGDSPIYRNGKLIHAGPPIKISSKTVDTRTHIPIISVTHENIFPEQWLSSPIEAHATGLFKKELKRSIYLLDVAMSKYPILLLRENIKAIYLLNSLTLYGVAADASHSDNAIYIVNTGGEEYTDEYLESLFHHAFWNLMQQKSNKVREPNQWEMPRFAPQKIAWELPSADPEMKLVYQSNEDGPEHIYALENSSFSGLTLLKQFRQRAPDGPITCPLRCKQTNPILSARTQQAIKAHGFVIPKTVVEDGPLWSHDRKQIAFRSTRDSDSFELYVTQTDGSNLRRLTYTRHVTQISSRVGAACWSPDDRRLAYVLHDEHGDNLFVVNSDGTGEKKLTIMSGKPGGIAEECLAIDRVVQLIGWLADGRILVVTERPFDGRTLYSILPDSTGLTPLSENGQAVVDALLSPDKKQIAIRTVDRLIVKDLKSNSVRYFSGPGLYEVAWSPDSKRIAYAGFGLTIIDLETLSTFGLDVRVSTNTPGSFSFINSGDIVSNPVWSPDGKKIAYLLVFNTGVNSASRNEMWVVNADGRDRRQLTAETHLPGWSPDGKYIIFIRHGAGIYLIKPDGSGERYIAKGAYPQWIP